MLGMYGVLGLVGLVNVWLSGSQGSQYHQGHRGSWALISHSPKGPTGHTVQGIPLVPSASIPKGPLSLGSPCLVNSILLVYYLLKFLDVVRWLV